MHKREQVAAHYARLLAGVDGVETPTILPSTTRTSWFVYVIRLARGLDRTAIAARLADLGIPVRPYFLPIHLQPYMVDRFGYQPGRYPVTEDLGERGLALPFSGVMRLEQVEQVVEALKRVIG